MSHPEPFEDRLHAWGRRHAEQHARPRPAFLAAPRTDARVERALRAHRRWVRSASLAAALAVLLVGAAVWVFMARPGAPRNLPRDTSEAAMSRSAADTFALGTLRRLNRSASEQDLFLPEVTAPGGPGLHEARVGLARRAINEL